MKKSKYTEEQIDFSVLPEERFSAFRADLDEMRMEKAEKRSAVAVIKKDLDLLPLNVAMPAPSSSLYPREPHLSIRSIPEYRVVPITSACPARPHQD